jgi:DNA modification methylase
MINNKLIQIKKKINGIYNKKNKLNNLTGSEWQYSTKTVISKSYPSNLQHKLRSQHGGQKPPDLCSDLIKIFTKKNALILDPLSGVGGSLIGAALSKRKAIGIELNNKWIKIYKKVCKLEKLEEFPVYLGNCNAIINEKIKNDSIDFVITDVPYWIMDKLKKSTKVK